MAIKKLPKDLRIATPCCGKKVRVPFYRFATFIGSRTCTAPNCGIRWVIKAEVLTQKPNFGVVHEITWSLHPKTKVAGWADPKYFKERK